VHLARTPSFALISACPGLTIERSRSDRLAQMADLRIGYAAELGAFVAGIVAIALLTAAYTWGGVTNPTVVALSFLLVVLLVAATSTRRVAVATSLTAFIGFNFFFLPPVGTLTIADPQNWVALFTLLSVSIVASHLSAQVRHRAQEATARRDELARLFDLTRDILLTSHSADAVGLIAQYIARRFGLKAVTICVHGSSTWEHYHSPGHTLHVERRELDAALAAAKGELKFDARERTYRGHARLPMPDGTTVSLVPLRIASQPIGILALQGEDVHPGAADAIAGVTAIAIERTHLLWYGAAPNSKLPFWPRWATT
jgi:two-component system sensor histidine kinase KdpD